MMKDRKYRIRMKNMIKPLSYLETTFYSKAVQEIL